MAGSVQAKMYKLIAKRITKTPKVKAVIFGEICFCIFFLILFAPDDIKIGRQIIGGVSVDQKVMGMIGP